MGLSPRTGTRVWRTRSSSAVGRARISRPAWWSLIGVDLEGVVGGPIIPDFRLIAPIGLSCEELFAGGFFVDGRTTIGALRFDSLGPGEAPD